MRMHLTVMVCAVGSHYIYVYTKFLRYMNKKEILIIIFCLVCGLLPAQETRVHVGKAGTLISNFTEKEANDIIHLTVTGSINAIDFKHLRNGFGKLAILDLSNADIRSYMGKEGTYPERIYVYPANCVPAYAFCTKTDSGYVGKPSLQHIVLSEKIKNIEDAAFKDCKNLTICRINKKTSPNLLPGALADSIAAIFVPLGSRDSYRVKDRWEDFAVLEGEPVTVHLQIGGLETLKEAILKTEYQPNEINFITIEGKLDNADFRLIRDYMPNLVGVDIKNTTATEIPDFTFTQKKYLMRIELPKGLKSIGQRAFSNCEHLRGNIELPAEVTSIAFGAFMGCKNLRKVVVTGNSLTSIGEDLFGQGVENKLEYRF